MRPPGLSLRDFATSKVGACSGAAEPVPRKALIVQPASSARMASITAL